MIFAQQTPAKAQAQSILILNAKAHLGTPNSQIGLVEIGAVRATRDAREVGGFNPNVRAIIAYNTDSRVTPTIRANGILTAQIVPQGGRVPGSSSIVQLDGWNWEDAAYKTDNGIHLNWPRMHTRKPTRVVKIRLKTSNLRLCADSSMARKNSLFVPTEQRGCLR